MFNVPDELLTTPRSQWTGEQDTRAVDTLVDVLRYLLRGGIYDCRGYRIEPVESEVLKVIRHFRRRPDGLEGLLVDMRDCGDIRDNEAMRHGAESVLLTVLEHLAAKLPPQQQTTIKEIRDAYLEITYDDADD